MGFFATTTCFTSLCCLLFAVHAKEEENTLVKKPIDAIRGQRSASGSRNFKSGPAPGSWYYIMGHGHDTKRNVGEHHAFDSQLTPPRIPLDLPYSGSPGVYRHGSRAMNSLASGHYELQPSSDGDEQLTAAHRGGRDRAFVSGEVADEDNTVLVKLPSGATTGESHKPTKLGASEARWNSQQHLLNEFLEFLDLKERNVLSRCLQPTDE